MFGALAAKESLLDRTGLYKHVQKGRQLSGLLRSAAVIDEQAKLGSVLAQGGQIEFDTEVEAKEDSRRGGLLAPGDPVRLTCEVDKPHKKSLVLGTRRESKCSTFSCGPHHLRFTKSRLLEHPVLEDDVVSVVSSSTSVDVGNLDDFSDFEHGFDKCHDERDNWEDEELKEAFAVKLNFSPLGKTVAYELLPKAGYSPVQTVIQPDQPSQLHEDNFRLFQATVMYPELQREDEHTLDHSRNCYSPVSVPPASKNRSDFFDGWDNYTGKLLSCAKDKLTQ